MRCCIVLSRDNKQYHQYVKYNRIGLCVLLFCAMDEPVNSFLGRTIFLGFSEIRKEAVRVGQPSFFLVGDSHVSLFEEPTWFVFKKYVQRGSTPSVNTWNAVAHDLKTWFQFLLAINVDWREATEAHRRTFADAYAQAVSSNGREYSEITINRRLSTVLAFYRFAQEQRWCSGMIGSDVELVERRNLPIDGDMLAHIRSSNWHLREKDPLLLKVGRSDVVRPMQVKELRKLCNHLGPNAADRRGDMRRVRDRLIVDCAIYGGLRLNDVIQKLTTLKFLSLIVESGQELQEFPIIIEKSKGKVTRQATLPGWLILDIQAYIDGERAESVKRGPKGNKAIQLFLGHANSKVAGRPISISAVQKMFELACRQCGITEIVPWINHVTGEKQGKEMPKHSYHDLRHNCAVLTYHAEVNAGNLEPWKVVQVKLGHKSVKVTMDTYLAYVSIFGEKQNIVDVRKMIGLR
jgi:integrase